jgi:serine phosphatase RsbU (regulator of sigma subunit)
LTEKALELAKQFRKCLFQVAFSFYAASCFAQFTSVDSLRKKLAYADNDSVRCSILAELCETSTEKNRINYIRELQTISKANLQSKPFFKKSFATSQLLMASEMADKGDIRAALEKLTTGQQIMKDLGNEEGIGQALYRMAEIYITEKDFQRAFDLATESMKIMRRVGNLKGIADCCEDIGNYHEYLKKNYPAALSIYEEGLTISRRIKYIKRAGYLLGNIGRIYYKQGKFEDALVENFESLRLKEIIDDKKGIGFSYHKIGQNYLALGRVDLAAEYGNKSLAVGLELGYPDNIQRSADLLKNVYERSGKFAKALEMAELSVRMKDSLISLVNQRAAIHRQLQSDYELKMERQKAAQLLRDTIWIEENKQAKFTAICTAIGLLATACFLVVVIRSLRISNKQKKIIEEKNREITDSINYAQRIQRALLASDSILTQHLPDHFIFFQPKDVVSGDFYWASVLADGRFAIITADSTGHGVPGAIMSMLNTSALKEAVEAAGLTEPSDILNYTRSIIIKALSNDGSKEGGKDGMDCNLVIYDRLFNSITYAAAQNPIWIVRGEKLIELAADRMPVGKHDRDSTPFSQNVFALETNDLVYTFIDGMADQFGGPKGKKFMYSKLKSLFLSVSPLPLQSQKREILEQFSVWKGEHEQVDDICVIGVRI